MFKIYKSQKLKWRGKLTHNVSPQTIIACVMITKVELTVNTESPQTKSAPHCSNTTVTSVPSESAGPDIWHEEVYTFFLYFVRVNYFFLNYFLCVRLFFFSTWGRDIRGFNPRKEKEIEKYASCTKN